MIFKMTDLLSKPIVQLLLLLLAVKVLSQSFANSDKPRIVGGEPAKQGQFPYVVSLQLKPYKGITICGGGILNKRWILTAAHCLIKKDLLDNLTVYAGTVFSNKEGSYYDVEHIKIHEKYDFDTWVNDIGLVKTQEPLKFSKFVHNIHLPNDEIIGKPKDEVIAVGWGFTKTPLPNDKPNLQLRFVKLKIMSFENCVSALPNVALLRDTVICAGGSKGFGTCRGDSGSPLIQIKNKKAYVAGLVSWGRPCAIGKPDIFTRVSYYVPWIQEQIKL